MSKYCKHCGAMCKEKYIIQVSSKSERYYCGDCWNKLLAVTIKEIKSKGL